MIVHKEGYDTNVAKIRVYILTMSNYSCNELIKRRLDRNILHITLTCSYNIEEMKLVC